MMILCSVVMMSNANYYEYNKCLIGSLLQTNKHFKWKQTLCAIKTI